MMFGLLIIIIESNLNNIIVVNRMIKFATGL